MRFATRDGIWVRVQTAEGTDSWLETRAALRGDLTLHRSAEAAGGPHVKTLAVLPAEAEQHDCVPETDRDAHSGAIIIKKKKTLMGQGHCVPGSAHDCSVEKRTPA